MVLPENSLHFFIYLGDDRPLSPSRREIGVRGRVVKYYPGWVSESHHFEILSMPHDECNICNNLPSFFLELISICFNNINFFQSLANHFVSQIGHLCFSPLVTFQSL